MDTLRSPPVGKGDDCVLMLNKRRRKGQNPKLQPKFVGPYEVIDCYPSHTYKVERHNQISIQSESRLKHYTPCKTPTGQAPTRLEATRRSNMKGVAKKKVEVSFKQHHISPSMLL